MSATGTAASKARRPLDAVARRADTPSRAVGSIRHRLRRGLLRRRLAAQAGEGQRAVRMWLVRLLLRRELRALEARLDPARFEHELSTRIDALRAAIELLS